MDKGGDELVLKNINILVGILGLMSSLYGFTNEQYKLFGISVVIVIITFLLGIKIQKNQKVIVQKNKEYFQESGLKTIHFPTSFRIIPNVTIVKEFGWEYSWRIKDVSKEKFTIEVNKLVGTSGSRNGRMGFVWRAKGEKTNNIEYKSEKASQNFNE